MLIALLLSLVSPVSVAGASDFEYTVNDVRDTVSLVSLRHYGTFNAWREIVLINRLPPPYTLKPGQVLKLPREPLLDPREGAGLVVEYWRGRSPRPKPRPAPVRSAEPGLPTEVGSSSEIAPSASGPFAPPQPGEDGTIAAPSPSPTPRKLETFRSGPSVGTDYPAMEPGEGIRPPAQHGPKIHFPRVEESNL